ncbi:hypothetical protein BC937DRAFT_88854, partial [Endogone sp. FLAS-F59071]
MTSSALFAANPPTKSSSIAKLKDLIKQAKTPRFNDIAARELTLWKVNISIDDEEALAGVLLEDNEEEDIQKLLLTWNVFPDELEEDKINVIVKCPA